MYESYYGPLACETTAAQAAVQAVLEWDERPRTRPHTDPVPAADGTADALTHHHPPASAAGSTSDTGSEPPPKPKRPTFAEMKKQRMKGGRTGF